MAQKKKRQKSIKDIIYLHNRLDGESPKDAKKVAGFDRNMRLFDLESSAQEQLLTAMAKAGISLGGISQKLAEGFEAYKLDRFGDRHPDFDIRLRYINTVLEILGLNKAIKIDITSGGTKLQNVDPKEFSKMVATATAEEIQKYLADQTVKDAEDAQVINT